MRSVFRKKIITFGALLGIVLFIFVVIFTINTRKNPPDTKIQIRYGVTIQNTSNNPIKDATIEVATPLRQTIFQKCTNIEANQPFEEGDDNNEQQTLAFKWPLFPPHTTKIIVVRSEIDLWNISFDKDDAELGNYLDAEPFIESNDQNIRELAAKLKAEHKILTAKRTFDWVKQNINYIGYIKHTRGALYALKNRKGDCTEFACLFVALCRANEIPARVLGGFVSSKSTVLDLADYHNWAQFFAEGKWHIADPQRNILMEKQETYITFQVLRPESGTNKGVVRFIGGDGMKVTSRRF